jgi:hypothetical protein
MGRQTYDITKATESAHDKEDDIQGLVGQKELGDKKFSVNGKEEYAVFDLGEPKDIAALAIAWFDGKVRRQQFEIQLGNDDPEKTRRVAASVSSGTTDDYEEITFERPIRAQFIKLLNLGNNFNDFMSIRGIRALGPEEPEDQSRAEQPATEGEAKKLQVGEAGAEKV